MTKDCRTQQNIENEILWRDDNIWVKKDHFLMKWPFVNPQRQKYAYKIARGNVRSILQDYLKKNEIIINNALVAPCGSNADQDILEGMAEEFYGIEVSQKAIDKCPEFIHKKVGDIINSEYKSNFFDAVFSFLFFHHLHQTGFEPYLNEFYRILKKEGLLCILEPGNLYPLSWIMFLGRKIFGNISGLVPNEGPIFPPKFTNALVESGIQVEEFRTVSFSHVRIPVPLQKIINTCLKPLHKVPSFNQMGWMLLWICRKF